MCKNVNFSRVIINILFFVFFVVLVSVIFSIAYPLILKAFGKAIPAPNDPVFDNIQIAIVFIVLVVTVIFRKYFYLPVKTEERELEIDVKQNIEDNAKEQKNDLDIKTGREI